MQKCAFCYKNSSEPISGAPRPRYRSGIAFQVIKLHAKHHICYIEQQKRAIVALKGRSRRASPPAGDNEAKRNAEYNPLTDTCIKAFVRLLAEMPAETDP